MSTTAWRLPLSASPAMMLPAGVEIQDFDHPNIIYSTTWCCSSMLGTVEWVGLGRPPAHNQDILTAGG